MYLHYKNTIQYTNIKDVLSSVPQILNNCAYTDLQYAVILCFTLLAFLCLSQDGIYGAFQKAHIHPCLRIDTEL